MGGILASEYNILEADNGRDALDIMCERGEQGIDAVLLDLHMPGQTGFDVLAEKQANPAIADIPVIVITAYIACACSRKRPGLPTMTI